MSRGDRLAEVLSSLAAARLEEAEVYAKTGRSRHVALSVAGELVAMNEEAGWAVRAGDRKGSFFWAESGEPRPLAGWPRPAGAPLVLAGPELGSPWTEPRDFEAPLLAERESLALLHAIDRELASELPGARLVSARLDDGASESQLANSRGLRVAWRSRLAALRLEAVGPGGQSTTLALAEREPRRFAPKALARRLADNLSLAASGRPPEPGPADSLLAPAVVAVLLAAWVAGPAGELRGPVADGLTLVDDGRLPGGALEAPFDGAGAPTRRRVLLERGQPVLAAGSGPFGIRRASWRDAPRLAPSHLYLEPAPRVSVASLLARLQRGHYWIEATSPVATGAEPGAFRVEVSGFAVEGGRARAPVAGALLTGTFQGLFEGALALARDLSFFPLDGMVGSPTLLVHGLRARPAGNG